MAVLSILTCVLDVWGSGGHAGVPRGRVETATASSRSPGGWVGSLERPVQDGDEVVPAGGGGAKAGFGVPTTQNLELL